MGDGVQVSDRLRVRGIEGRSSGPAPDKEFSKVGYDGNRLGSTGLEVGEGSNGMPTPAIQFLLCGHNRTKVCESVSYLAREPKVTSECNVELCSIA